MKAENITETTHDEFLKLLIPVIEFMHTNGFSYFMVAGKEEVCSQYVGGKAEDISGILESLFINHTNIKDAVEEIINQINKEAK